MKKIKELLKRLENALLEKPKVFEKTKLYRNYVTKILADKELFHIRREVEDTIASWDDNVVTQDQKKTVRVIMDTVIDRNAVEMTHNHGPLNSKLPVKTDILINLAVAKVIVPQLSYIVGVQPMKAPAAQAFSMRYKYEDAESGVKDNDGNSSLGKRMSLEVVSAAIEATSRQLKTGFTIEAIRDLKAMNGIDIEDIVTQMAGSEIASEVIREVLADLLKLGTTIDISEMGLISKALTNDNSSADTLAFEINKAMSNIALTTRRGAGNLVVASPLVVAMLQSSKVTDYKLPDSNGEGFDPNHLIYAGSMRGGSVKVYVSHNIGDNILVGYKGTNSNVDTGYIYAPYLPATAGGVTMNPLTFEPVVGFMARYGKSLNGGVENAKEFYRVIKLDPDTSA